MCLLSTEEDEEVIGEATSNVAGDSNTTVAGEHQIASDTSILNCGEYNYTGANYMETFASCSTTVGDSSILMSDAMELTSGAAGIILDPEGVTMTCAVVMLG